MSAIEWLLAEEFPDILKTIARKKGYPIFEIDRVIKDYEGKFTYLVSGMSEFETLELYDFIIETRDILEIGVKCIPSIYTIDGKPEFYLHSKHVEKDAARRYFLKREKGLFL